MVRGDHIYVRRSRRGRRYSHHGIYCGDGTVIHFVGPRRGESRVQRTSLEEFAAGDEVRVRKHRRDVIDPEATVRNAESVLGQQGFHLVRNNCEHLAAWCRTGRARSVQVQRWALAAQGTASVAVVQVPSVPIVFAGVVGAGLYAYTRPRRR